MREALLEASLEAWDALVDLTLERDALFLLLAGDLYDGPDRGLRAQLRFRRGLQRLSEAGIQAFMVHGNHDPVDEGWSAIRDWPDGVTIFCSDRVSRGAVERDGRRIATVHGRSYATRATRENLALGFRRGAEPGLHIGLLHCNVGGVAGHAPYSPCSIEDLSRAGMDYWALGHVHVHNVLRRGDPWIVYPGNLQGRSPQPGERGAKGAVVVEAEGERITNVRHVALDRVRFLLDTIDVTRCEDLGALEEALGMHAERSRIEHADRGLLLRVRLVGASPIHRELARNDAQRELLAALRDRFDGASPMLWWDSIESDGRAPAEPRLERERDDFGAGLLGFSDALVRDREALTALAEDELLRLPARIKGVAIPALDAAAVGELVESGGRLALELLGGGEPDMSNTGEEA